MSKKLFTKLFVFLLVVGLLFAVAPTGQAQAATYTVCTGGGCDYTTIQAAITAATAGDTITVAAGTYTETFEINKSVSLIGAGRDVTTIIAGDPAYGTIDVSAAGVTISGFKVTNTSLAGVKADGIYVMGGADNCTITNNEISGNGQNGISIVSSNNTVTNNIIAGNSTNSTLGAGVALFNYEGYIATGNVVQFNTITGNAGLGGIGSISSGANDISKNWWGSATGPRHTTNPGGTGDKLWTNQSIALLTYSPWLGFMPGTTPMDWYLNTTGTIQDGIDAAANGETIHVLAGTYVEDVVVTDKYFNLIGAVDTNGDPISILEGSLFINNPSYSDDGTPELTTLKNIYFERTDSHLLILQSFNGGLIENCLFDGNNTFANNGINLNNGGKGNSKITVKDSIFKDGLYVGIGGYANEVTVNGSTFTNVKSGINMQGNGNLVVTDSTFLTKPVSDGDSYGIRYTAGDITGAKSMTITGSTFEIDLSGGFTPASGNYHTSIYTRGTGLDTLTVEGNTILGGAVNTSLSATLDVSPNWWGSIAGPAAGTLVGTAEYAPWCGDAECSFLVYPMLSTGLQASIDATPAGGTLYVPAGTYTDGGTDGYNVAGKTIILGDGVIIQNSSPCFTVEDSYSTITTETIGGATCVPTSGSNGIDVGAALVNIIIEGIEFDGSEQTTGAGIAFAGAITDFQIVNNNFHDLDGSGVVFNGTITNNQGIQGNIFQRVGSPAIVAPAGTLDAKYNSWDAFAGVTIENVDNDPWTHAAIELRSTNPTVDNWANQVFVDDEITYEVYGVFQNITAADFTLTYDPTKLKVVSITPVTGIFQSADGELVDELVEGQIRYDGTTYPGFTSADDEGTVLYTVTFKALGAGDAALAIDPATDLFGMIPPSGPSTNVYAAELDSVTVHKIDRPTLTPTNLDGLYVVDVSHEISTVIANPATGGVWTESPTEPDAIGWIRISDALVSDITQLQFKYTDGVWYDFSVQDQYGGQAVQQDGADVIARFGNYNFGFDMPNDWSDVDAFRVTFAEAGTHTVTIGIYDMMDTAENFYGTDDILLTEITQMITVYNPPTVSSDDIQGYYLTGEERIFNVSMDNPEALDGGADYALLIFDYRLDGVSTTDITSFEYYAQDLGAWIDMGSRAYETYGDCTEGVGICGQFGWAPGGFGPIAAGFENISQFRINFANSFSTPLNFTLELSGKLLVTDAEWTPLTTFTGTLDVYDKPIITIETDQYFIVNEPGQFAVTIENPAPGRPYGNNIVFDVVIPDHLTTDFGTMSCGFGTTTWPVTLESDGAGGVKARILGLDPEGRFDVGAPFGPMTVTCTATLLTAGDYAPSWSMVDMTLPVERIVQTGSGSMTAYTAPIITADFPTGPYAAGVPVTVPVSITNPDGIPGLFELTLDLPAGTTFTFGGNTYTCDLTGCPAIPLTSLPITDSDLVITFAESFTGEIDFTLTDTTWDPDRVLATLTQGVVVGGDYTVTGTFSMQGRTKRAGVEVTFTWGGNSYTVTEETIEQISNNLVAILKYGGDYTITVNQARYLDITTAHGAHINPATALSLVLDSLELRAGDADDDNDVDLDDATIVGGLYGTGTIADRGDINFDNRVNIQDLALIGGNYELQSTTPTADYYAYGDWMQ